MIKKKKRVYTDPQLDMRTWKQPKPEKSSGGVNLNPSQRQRTQSGKTRLA